MKKSTKIITGITALVLSAVLLFVTVITINGNRGNSNLAQAQTRTVYMDNKVLESDEVFSRYENASLTTEGTVTTFKGSKKFDTSLFSEDELISINQIDENLLNVDYEISVDKETGKVSITVGMPEENGEYAKDTLVGTYFTNANGKADALFVLDGEPVLLSDLCGDGVLDNIGFFSNLWKNIKKVFNALIKVIVVSIAPTFELLGGLIAIVLAPVSIYQSNKNYESNKKQNVATLDEKTNYPNYIDAQHSFYNWSMGFDSLEDNGCGAIATYNALVFTGKIAANSNAQEKSESLANIIRSYETSSGTLITGALGINPAVIGPILAKYGVNVTEYRNSFGAGLFESRCRNLKNNEMAILCYWYLYKGKPLAHNICILKEYSSSYKNGYAFRALNNGPDKIIYSMYDFLFKSNMQGFLNGWIVTK